MNIESDRSITELKQGYIEADRRYSCLFCGRQFEEGDIYTSGSRLVDARTAAGLHIQEMHESVFKALISNGKNDTGLTDTQKELLSCFYEGLTDKEIAEKTDISTSTVRFQRFKFREKARQAKVFLALYGLTEERIKERLKTNNAPGVDEEDDSSMNEEEEQKVIMAFFSSLNPLKLKSFSAKEKKKLVLLRLISEQFERVKRYSEDEVNEVLRDIYSDYVTLRRSLIDYGFMERTTDCREYWLR